MKTKIFTFLAAIMALFVISTNVSAQAVGDYGSTAALNGTPGTMNWFTGTWYVCTSVGTWAGATATVTPPTNTKNVWILAGDSVVISSGTASTLAKCLNLEIAGKLNQVGTQVELSQTYGNLHVASTGAFYARQKYIWGNVNTTAIALTVDAGGKLLTYDQFKLQGANGYATTITNNGIFGAATAVANGSATVYVLAGNTNVTFTGSGTTILRGLLADTNAGSCNFTIDQNMTFCPNSGSVAIKLQNNSGVGATTARSVTINPGKTVTIISNGWFANNAAYANIDANNTYNINGTLDVSAGSIYFGCTTNTTAGQQGTTNSQIINIGSNGVLKCGTIVDVNKPQAGQTLAVNVTTGGKITYAGTAYQTLPTASTFTVNASPYAMLTNSNSKLSFKSASATALTLNTGLTVGDSLSLAAATTLSGASNLTVNGTLALAGKLTNNSGNLTLGSTAVFSGSSTNYIDLATNNGTFTCNGVTSSSTLFPIGTGSSYTPLTLANTTGTPNITTKLKTTFDNAVEDVTKVVNLQWSVVASSSTTSDITYQFNGTNKAASFDVAASCELGNYTSVWAATNLNTPSGADPYTVSAIGMTIPTTTNLYVVGNTGKVVRLAPTTSTWSGAVDTNWATAGNWNNGVPDNTLEAIIPASLTNYPVISVLQNIKNLTIAGGASLTNNGTLNIYGPAISNSGTLSGSGVYAFVGTDVQTITGSFSVNHLSLNNNSGVVNNGTLTVNTDLAVIAGGITGTAPVYGTDLPVTFTGSGTSSTGLILSPSTGSVGTLTVNGLGTLSLSAAGAAKDLVLTAGSLDNSSNNITVSGSVTRDAGALVTAPIYSGSIPVTFTGSTVVNSSYEIAPSAGSISVFTVNGSGTYTTMGSFSTAGDITVSAGTLKMGGNISAQNISVATGAIFNSDNTATSGSRHTLTVGNGAADNDATLTVNGTLGNGTKWTNDGIDIEVSANAKTFTVNGTGTIGISGMRPAVNANSRALDITINNSMYLDRDNGGASNIEPTLTLQNGTGTYARTLTIASGATVAYRGNGGFHGMRNAISSSDEGLNNHESSTSNQGNCTYNINGTLDLASSYTNTAFNLNTCSFSGSTQAVTVNVNNGGSLKLANIVKLYTALIGQSASIVPATGSTVEYGYNGTETILLTTGIGTAPTLPAAYSNLKVNNTSGITLPTASSVTGDLTITAGNIGSAIILSGTSAQAITSNGNSLGSLTINNAAGVSLASATIVNSALTLTSGKLTLGANDLTIGASGSIANASATSYVVTDGAGKLIQSCSGATEKLLPVGTASSYDPATVTPTDATVFAVKVGTALSGIPASGIQYNAKEWNLSSSIPSSTLVKFTPSAVTAIGLYPIIGYYTASAYTNVAATLSGNTYSATFSTFLPFVTGSTDVSTGVANSRNSGVYVSVSGAQIIVNGVSAGDVISVFNLSGQQVKQINTVTTKTSITLKSGAYLIKVNDKVMKVVL